MGDFGLWFSTGIEHILNWTAYDHVLFLVVLSCACDLSQKRKILLLVTAFTIGHSLTLVLSALNIFALPVNLIEILIPVTILITAIYNVLPKKERTIGGLNYWMALSFGLIHGMGFSFVLREMLGKEEGILVPLFAFNIGIEIAQVIVISVILIFYLFSDAVMKVPIRKRAIFVSIAAIIFSLLMIVDRIIELKN